MHLPGIYQPSNRFFYRKLLQVKRKCEIFCFCKRLCWQTKLLKGNRLLDMTPGGARPATLLKKRLRHRWFPANFVKFSRTLFSQSTSGRLLLWLIKYEILIVRNSHQRCSIKKVALKNFTKFTGKHLCQSPFLNKVSGVSLQH